MTDDDDKMLPEVAWLSTIGGLISFCTCLFALLVGWRASRRDGTMLPRTVNLHLFLVLLGVDVAWGLKFAANGISVFAGASPRIECQLFGFLETWFTLARAGAGMCFWAHVCCITHWRFTRFLHPKKRERKSAKVVLAVVLAITVAVAITALCVGWVSRKSGGQWCWVNSDNIAQVLALGYGLDAVQVLLACTGLIIPLLCFRTAKEEWAEDVRAAMRRRAMVAFITPATGVLLLIGMAVGGYQRQGSLQYLRLVSAIFIPMQGAADSIVFLWSEPGLVRYVFFEKEPLVDGFTLSLDRLLQETPLPAAAYNAIEDAESRAASSFMETHPRSAVWTWRKE
jgi:hypothetical protein